MKDNVFSEDSIVTSRARMECVVKSVRACQTSVEPGFFSMRSRKVIVLTS